LDDKKFIRPKKWSLFISNVLPTPTDSYFGGDTG
jgi:hypothetical protein